jgi:hypothetical protein
VTKNLQNIKESFEKLLEKYKAQLKAEQIHELAVKKRIEDLTGDIARVMKNLQAVDNIKERE